MADSGLSLRLSVIKSRIYSSHGRGRPNEFEGGEVNALERGRVNTVKTLKFENGGGGVHDTPSSNGGADPGHGTL